MHKTVCMNVKNTVGHFFSNKVIKGMLVLVMYSCIIKIILKLSRDCLLYTNKETSRVLLNTMIT